jgi:glutamate-1-semialdehyde 2,1-aminomutase
LVSNVEKIISEYKFTSNLQFSGHPTWAFLNWSPTEHFSVEEMKTYFAQLMYESGVLILNSHNITLAHNEQIQSKILSAYGNCIKKLQESIEKGNLREQLKARPLTPLFKVR